MIRAILFDVDGTLIDSNDLHAAAWQQAFAHFGAELPIDVIRAQIGKGGDNLIPALLAEGLVESRQEEIETYRSTLFRRDYLPRATPFPGVRALFERLYERGIRIVLATSAHQAELDFHRSLIGSEDLIHAATSKNDVERSKPCPDLFEAALRAAGPVDPQQALVVGDSPWDMEAAQDAALKAIALRCGGFADEVLRKAGAAAIFDDPGQLARLFPDWLPD